MKKYLLVVPFLVLSVLACNALLPQTQGQGQPPLSEDSVPRVSIEDAKAAFEGGEAVIVDVRSAEAYAEGHVAGAISIPLGEFENNIANVPLDKDQWIIPYCT